MDIVTTVGLPIYNEEANLGHLLSFLRSEPGIARIVAVDDRSDDASLSIARAAAELDPRIEARSNAERSGQLAGWLSIARTATTQTVVFIDADSLPEPGSVARIATIVERDPSIAIASGRVVPDPLSAKWPAARFRASVLDSVRNMQYPKESIIGRFFAVRREWFLLAATRSDIIANDAYLGGVAKRDGMRAVYVRDAVCRYCEAQNTFDFAAQRQRADAGYAQLRELGVLARGDEPSAHQYLQCIAAAAVRDPAGALAWGIQQLKARGVRAYRQSGRDAGAWEVQASTKRRLP